MDGKDLELFLKDAKIVMLEKRIEEFENGEVYSGLINELASVRAERDLYRDDANLVESIRRIVQ